MSDTQLVVLSLADQESARDLVRQLEAIDKLDANVTIVDAAIAFKTRRGKPKLRQLKVAGSSSGGVLGAIGGAFAGLTSIFRNAGIDDDMMRRTAEQLEAREVALFILYTGHWDRSSSVLSDALAAHGIRYAASGRPQSYGADMAAPVPVVDAPPIAEAAQNDKPVFEDEPVFGDESPTTDETVDGNEQTSIDEPVFEAEPEFDEEVAVPAVDDDDQSAAEIEDPVAAASRAAILGAAGQSSEAGAAASADMETPNEALAVTGVEDEPHGEESLETVAPIDDAAARLALLELERKYGGLEIGRIAGELAHIGRAAGEREMPILSALLIHRSGILQRIATDVIASAASAHELAELLEATGGLPSELGVTDMDQDAVHLASASTLAIRAADAGASQTDLIDKTK